MVTHDKIRNQFIIWSTLNQVAAEIVRANKIEENVAMINEIRGAIEAKFYDWTAREWRTVELVIGNSLWWNYTEEGVCVIMLKLTCSDESSPLGYTNRINLNRESILESPRRINESTKMWLNVLHFYFVNAKYWNLNWNRIAETRKN